MGRKKSTAPPASGKSRAQTFRDNLKKDPEKYQAYLEREKARYRARVKAGKLKNVKSMTDREHRAIQKSWKNASSRYRARQKAQLPRLDTPPTSPASGANSERESARKTRGRKKLKKNRAKCYREMDELKKKLKKCEKRNAKYRKREERRKKRKNKTKKKQPMDLDTFLAAFREKYSKTKSLQEKQLIRKVFAHSFLKKYEVMKEVSRSLGISHKALGKECRIEFRRQKRNMVQSRENTQLIQDFLMRDDNTTMKAGKKDTRTRRGVKKQIRLLNDTLVNLHLKFLSEYPQQKVSLATFCRARPFYVIHAKISDRDTCLCMKHDNIRLLLEPLARAGVITSKDPMTYVSQLVCDTSSKSCMYGDCMKCQNNDLPILSSEVGKTKITYEQWEACVEAVDGGTRKTTKKVSRSSDAWDAFSLLGEQLKPRFSTHVYNIRNQYRAVRSIREKLSAAEALFHIDFSESYALKYDSEIQALHFGANNRTASLHTGVCYTGQNGITPFCSISDNGDHNAAGIWAHLMPVLAELAPPEKFPTLHILSDGPTTQYRNRTNFALTQMLPFRVGYKTVIWNFLEAAHGKGAADGIGAVVKRTADRLVSQGTSIPNAAAL